MRPHPRVKRFFYDRDAFRGLPIPLLLPPLLSSDRTLPAFKSFTSKGDWDSFAGRVRSRFMTPTAPLDRGYRRGGVVTHVLGWVRPRFMTPKPKGSSATLPPSLAPS